MKPTRDVDPELGLLKSVARGNGELERARFELYRAFEMSDPVLAARWSRACRAAIQADMTPVDGVTPARLTGARGTLALQALDAIDAGIVS